MPLKLKVLSAQFAKKRLILTMGGSIKRDAAQSQQRNRKG